MEFINDELVIGKWEFFDCIKELSDFSLTEKHYKSDGLYFKEVYFLPNGEKYWIYEGWTKGYLFVHFGGDSPIFTYNYEVKNVDSCLYMFIFASNDKENIIYVLKKVSDNKFKKSEIGRRENIDREFVVDEQIIGEWLPVGFVDEIEDFKPEVDYSDCIWLKKIFFYENGIVERIYFDDEVFVDKWTRGYLLDQDKSVASKYTIQNIDGKVYMFLEWKMGNYVYGGADPSYYVFIHK